MTTTIDTRGTIDVPRPGRVGQGTAIEQQRAIAEVEATIVVAMRHPRSVPRAIEDMRETCKRKELADRAFFRYKRGNGYITGPSIHLARELARVWGNIQYGLTELRRDDDFGQSEMLAFAWDVQTNTRSSSIVINPHKRYTGGADLTELRDIYENNANVGARRVREAIFAVLPAWFVEEAKDLCGKTVADGGGVPLATRIANALEVFGNLGITVAQLETKLGTKQAKWTDQDVAQLRVIRQSLLRGEVTKDEEFPAGPDRVTAADIQKPAASTDTPGPAVPDETPGSGPAAGPGGRAKPLRKTTLGNLRNALKQIPFQSDDDAQHALTVLVGRDVPMLEALTQAEADKLLKLIDGALRDAEGDTEQAVSEIWRQVRVIEGGEVPDASA